tara:strand:- start:64 stop:603 length:540 start_codon:yes stop_codon:yes gene_type:complete
VKKPIKKRPRSSSAVMISLLKDIKEELVIDRQNKMRNALILATAIVMFAVPMNFMVEVTANYLDATSNGDLEFWPDNFLSPYYILFWMCLGFIIFAFWNFFRPISRIFLDGFDWEIAFKDVEKEGEEDTYHVLQDSVYECNICLEEFQSYRRVEIHEEACRTKNPKEWKKWDEDAEEEE